MPAFVHIHQEQKPVLIYQGINRISIRTLLGRYPLPFLNLPCPALPSLAQSSFNPLHSTTRCQSLRDPIQNQLDTPLRLKNFLSTRFRSPLCAVPCLIYDPNILSYPFLLCFGAISTPSCANHHTNPILIPLAKISYRICSSSSCNELMYFCMETMSSHHDRISLRSCVDAARSMLTSARRPLFCF